MSLVKEISEYRVSSVLNNDRKQFGKKYLFDGHVETCWNSDQGTPQWIQFGFPSSRKITKLKLQFQGGFVGKHCILESVDEGNGSKFEFFPSDINSSQEFSCSSNEMTAQTFKLTFLASTDFYGRIILYNFEMFDDAK